MGYRQRFIASNLIGLLIIVGAVLVYGWYLPLNTTPETTYSDSTLLFWQDKALYTIRADGTHLTRLSPAAEADPKRQMAVSPGCTGDADAGCYILIKHVLYDALGHGLPLPINAGYQWINAPSVWAPDGIHLAYMAAHTDTGERALLVYDLQQQIVWQVADGIDDSVVPAWSAACTELMADNCYIAYGVKTPAGESGNRLAVKTIATGDTKILVTLNGRGHVLRWSSNDELFYGGGELGWFSAFTNQPYITHLQNVTVSEPSPDMMYVAYNTVPSPQKPAELWVQPFGTENESPEMVFIFKDDDSNKQSAPQQILWSTDAKSFLAFDQGELIHYNIQRKMADILYRNDASHIFKGYAFAPTKDRVALVEASFAPHDPVYRLFVVSGTGEVTALLPPTDKPIILLAWLPADFAKKLLPLLETNLS